jgi:hypothetical protein
MSMIQFNYQKKLGLSDVNFYFIVKNVDVKKILLFKMYTKITLLILVTLVYTGCTTTEYAISEDHNLRKSLIEQLGLLSSDGIDRSLHYWRARPI